MKLLAIDTSSVACTVAMQAGDRIIERHEEQPREHTQILVPMIRSTLREAEVPLAEMDAIVLGNGPGSFIGMRIAASLAQGLAFASGSKIVPVSSLAAIAAEVLSQQDAEEVVVTQDAHMNEVYLGIYRRGASGLPEPLMPERLCSQQCIEELASSSARPRVAAGAGWQRYPELLARNRDGIDVVSAVLYPRGRHLLGLGAVGLTETGGIHPKDIAPAYLRQKVAQKPAPKP